MYNNIKLKICLLVGSFLLTACAKNWLDKPYSKSKFTPTTLEDAQSLLANEDIFNIRSGLIEESGTDNYYLTDADWGVLSDVDKNCYLWKQDIFGGISNSDWNYRYQKVFVANNAMEVLDKLGNISGKNELWKQVFGEALFYRANAFYQIAQGFAPVYEQATASQLAGIPLRLKSDLNEPTTRTDLRTTYERIIMDLELAQSLLPLKPAYKTRPSQWAVNALLARVYLSMSDYEKAFHYADLALKIDSTLMDFSSLNTAATNPIPRFNSETIFFEKHLIPGWFSVSRCKPDSLLIKSYEAGDLRRQVYFNANGLQFKGSYDGTNSPFVGLATDEILLIRAEAGVRLQRIENALRDINTLLKSRWIKNSYLPFSETAHQPLLEKILKERRKELVFRNLRWTDLRRLNKDTQTAKNLVRINNGTRYELKPNDKRYTLPIPDDVINATGITQNER